jgi:two-component system cell cycle sensor histidine kinase/response regulator CckA
MSPELVPGFAKHENGNEMDPHDKVSGPMYRRIVEAVPEGIWLTDPQGLTVFSNRRMAQILGVDFESMAGMSCFACLFPEDVAEARMQFERGLAGDRPPFDFRLRRADGSAIWVSIACMPVRDEDSSLFGILGLFSDITERKRTEDALRQSEERLRSLVDSAPVITWMTGPDQKGTFYNVQALAFTGLRLDEIVGDGYISLLHPEDRDRYLEVTSAAAAARAPFSTEVRLRRADGEYRWMMVSGLPRVSNGIFLGHIGTGVDVTALKRSYEQHLASQKLESLGVLAAGVAHDFNNFLGAIVVRAESAQTDIGPGSRAADDLDQIRLTALRAAQIVSQLMTFAGHESAPSEAIDVSRLVNEMLGLLKVSISKNARLRTELAADLPAIHANPAEIRQLLLNLIVNASEALEGRIGFITINTARATLDSADAVRLDVEDTGIGIAPELKSRIFDPFFTTRSAGRGLGLSTVQGVVRRLGGSIEVESTPGRGSRFAVLLPSIAAAPQGEFREIALPPPPAAPAATVLFVEDEPSMRSAVTKLLRRRNFHVIEAADGVSAVELLRSDPSRIDVVLLDVTLPGMTGREVFDRLRGIKPDVKVVLSTAYSRERTMSEFRERNTSGFIRKPYKTNDLVEMLLRAVGAP